MKHVIHRRDLRGVPFANILIERDGTFKNEIQPFVLGGVPQSDRLVKSGSFTEHPSNICDM